MKHLFTFVIILFCTESFAQLTDYTYTPEGKLLFTEVITEEGKSQSGLYKLAQDVYSEIPKRKKELEDENFSLSIEQKLTLHEKGILSRIPYADIQFDMKLEFKNGRYRYLLSDFEFLPYERNRYGKYVVLQRKRKDLESVVDTKEWKSHSETFLQAIEAEIAYLNMAMHGNPVSLNETNEKTVEVSDEW